MLLLFFLEDSEMWIDFLLGLDWRQTLFFVLHSGTIVPVNFEHAYHAR